MNIMALPVGGTPETILLVEDHAALLKLVKQILEDAGFTVIPASNAKQAIQLEADFPGTIDLLLSDVRLTGHVGPQPREKTQRAAPTNACHAHVRLPGRRFAGS
jgi:DNA-binding response OmpR family regulator